MITQASTNNAFSNNAFSETFALIKKLESICFCSLSSKQSVRKQASSAQEYKHQQKQHVKTHPLPPSRVPLSGGEALRAKLDRKIFTLFVFSGGC